MEGNLDIILFNETKKNENSRGQKSEMVYQNDKCIKYIFFFGGSLIYIFLRGRAKKNMKDNEN